MSICRVCRNALLGPPSVHLRRLQTAHYATALGRQPAQQPGEPWTPTRPPPPPPPPPPESHGESAQADDTLKGDLPLPLYKEICKELVWLKHSVKLADAVRRTLEKGNFQKALGLVRLAKGDQGQYTVAWNAVLSHVMDRGQTKIGWNLYNEMKKRQQTPNELTMTIFLAGLARRNATPKDVDRAKQVLESLDAEGSPVKRNVIHSNAALQVCLEAQDLDSLWQIVASMPGSGVNSADAATYCIVLTALRLSLLQNPSATDESKLKLSEEAAAVWQEVMTRWRSNELRIDEQLVCAYTKFLFRGQPNQTTGDKVLSIIEKVVGIPMYADKDPLKDMAHVRPPGGTQSVRPTQHLALATMHAVGLFRWSYPSGLRSATSYWEFLTTALKIEPDSACYSAYLRTLMYTGDSSKALDTMVTMAGLEKPGAETLRTDRAYSFALNACSNQAVALSSKDLLSQGPQDKFIAKLQAQQEALKPTLRNAEAILEMAAKSKDAASVIFPKMLSHYLHCAMLTFSGPAVFAALQRTLSILLPIEDAKLKPRNGAGSGKPHLARWPDTLFLMRSMISMIEVLQDRPGLESLGLDTSKAHDMRGWRRDLSLRIRVDETLARKPLGLASMEPSKKTIAILRTALHRQYPEGRKAAASLEKSGSELEPVGSLEESGPDLGPVGSLEKDLEKDLESAGLLGKGEDNREARWSMTRREGTARERLRAVSPGERDPERSTGSLEKRDHDREARWSMTRREGIARGRVRAASPEKKNFRREPSGPPATRDHNREAQHARTREKVVEAGGSEQAVTKQ